MLYECTNMPYLLRFQVVYFTLVLPNCCCCPGGYTSIYFRQNINSSLLFCNLCRLLSLPNCASMLLIQCCCFFNCRFLVVASMLSLPRYCFHLVDEQKQQHGSNSKEATHMGFRNIGRAFRTNRRPSELRRLLHVSSLATFSWYEV